MGRIRSRGGPIQGNALQQTPENAVWFMAFLSATIQFKPAWGEVDFNRGRILAAMEILSSRGVKLMVLPEMCISGYIFKNRDEIAPFCEDKDGVTYRQMSDFCHRHGVYVAYGFAERAGDLLFNTQNLVGPGGLLATYRKTHLYEADCSWAMPGDSGFLTVDTDLGRLGLGICMDLNFDDFVDFHIAQKTDVLCFSTCWLDEGFPVVGYWLDRLWGYEQTILLANSFGEERGTVFRGESAVISGSHLIARAPVDREAVLLIRHTDESAPD